MEGGQKSTNAPGHGYTFVLPGLDCAALPSGKKDHKMPAACKVGALSRVLYPEARPASVRPKRSGLRRGCAVSQVADWMIRSQGHADRLFSDCRLSRAGLVMLDTASVNPASCRLARACEVGYETTDQVRHKLAGGICRAALAFKLPAESVRVDIAGGRLSRAGAGSSELQTCRGRTARAAAVSVSECEDDTDQCMGHLLSGLRQPESHPVDRKPYQAWTPGSTPYQPSFSDSFSLLSHLPLLPVSLMTDRYRCSLTTSVLLSCSITTHAEYI